MQNLPKNVDFPKKYSSLVQRPYTLQKKIIHKMTENEPLLKLGTHKFSRDAPLDAIKISSNNKLEWKGGGLVCLKGEISGAPSIGAKIVG